MSTQTRTSPADEADHRFIAALDEAREQLANGWTPAEIAAVLEDAASVIDDLRITALRSVA